jgi:hypothetical protein
MAANSNDDRLHSFIKEMVRNFYHIAWGMNRDLSAAEYKDLYLIPTRDTGSPTSDELVGIYENAREAGLSIEEEQHHHMKIGSAYTAEAIIFRRVFEIDSAWWSLSQANFFLGLAVGSYPDPNSGDEPNPRKAMAKEAAAARYAKDPKQREKNFVRQCWLNWQKKPAAYTSKAAFARDMLTKCEHLTSQKKIEDWCRDWEEENRILASTVSTEPA